MTCDNCNSRFVLIRFKLTWNNISIKSVLYESCLPNFMNITENLPDSNIELIDPLFIPEDMNVFDQNLGSEKIIAIGKYLLALGQGMKKID